MLALSLLMETQSHSWLTKGDTVPLGGSGRHVHQPSAAEFLHSGHGALENPS